MSGHGALERRHPTALKLKRGLALAHQRRPAAPAGLVDVRASRLRPRRRSPLALRGSEWPSSQREVDGDVAAAQMDEGDQRGRGVKAKLRWLIRRTRLLRPSRRPLDRPTRMAARMPARRARRPPQAADLQTASSLPDGRRRVTQARASPDQGSAGEVPCTGASSRARAATQTTGDPKMTVTSHWRSGGSVSHTAAATSPSPNTSASCPDIATSVLAGGSCPSRTPAAQPLDPLAQQPPRRRGGNHARHRRLSRHRRQVAPASRDRAHAAVDQPAAQHRLAMLRPPSEHLKLHIAKLARRGHEPHPLRQRTHNMSSAMPTRPAPARRTVRMVDRRLARREARRRRWRI